jgi:hypothetical protein
MIRRIFSVIVGILAIFAGLYACGMTYEVAREFGSSSDHAWLQVVGIIVVGSIAFGGLTLGTRFVWFALEGKIPAFDGRIASALLGLGCFFPGFIFSFPVVMLCWAVHQANLDHAAEIALSISFSVGVTSAIVGCVLLFKRRRLSAGR